MEMDRHYLINEGDDTITYHPKCVSLVDIINKLADNELMVLECEQIHLMILAKLEVNRDMQINNMKIKRVI